MPAGRLALTPFAATALLSGWIVANLVPHSPPQVFSAILWGVVGGGVSYLVFSSEGATRPVSMMQASVADGVVAGIITATFGTVIVVLAASGAGGSGDTVSWLDVVEKVAIALAIGSVVGAILGSAVGLIGGPAVLARRRSGGQRRKRR